MPSDGGRSIDLAGFRSTNPKWQELEEAIIKTCDVGVHSPPSFHKLYRNAYDLVIAQKGELLYAAVADLLQRLAIKTFVTHIKAALLQPQHNALQEYVAQLKKFRDAAELAQDSLLYLERTICEPQKIPKIMEVADTAWHVPLISALTAESKPLIGTELDHDALVPVAHSLLDAAGNAINVLRSQLADDANDNSTQSHDNIDSSLVTDVAAFLKSVSILNGGPASPKNISQGNGSDPGRCQLMVKTQFLRVLVFKRLKAHWLERRSTAIHSGTRGMDFVEQSLRELALEEKLLELIDFRNGLGPVRRLWARVWVESCASEYVLNGDLDLATVVSGEDSEVAQRLHLYTMRHLPAVRTFASALGRVLYKKYTENLTREHACAVEALQRIAQQKKQAHVVVRTQFQSHPEHVKAIEKSLTDLANRPFTGRLVAQRLGSGFDSVIRKCIDRSIETASAESAELNEVFEFIKDSFLPTVRALRVTSELEESMRSLHAERLNYYNSRRLLVGGNTFPPTGETNHVEVLALSIENRVQEYLEKEYGSDFAERAYARAQFLGPEDSVAKGFSLSVFARADIFEAPVVEAFDIPILRQLTQDKASIYKKLFGTRKLCWNLAAGHAWIKMHRSGAPSVDLLVPTISMVILISLNHVAEISPATIENKLTSSNRDDWTEVALNDLRLLLSSAFRSLTTGPRPILIEAAVPGSYSVNTVLSARPIILCEQLMQPATQIHRSVEYMEDLSHGTSSSTSTPMAQLEDNVHRIDAAIVRIMKHCRSMRHKDLVLELGRAGISVGPGTLRKQLERLLDREFITRSVANPELYLYST